MTIFWPFDIGFVGWMEMCSLDGAFVHIFTIEHTKNSFGMYFNQLESLITITNIYRINKMALTADNSNNCEDVIIQSKACDLLQWRIVLVVFYNNFKA